MESDALTPFQATLVCLIGWTLLLQGKQRLFLHNQWTKFNVKIIATSRLISVWSSNVTHSITVDKTGDLRASFQLLTFFLSFAYFFCSASSSSVSELGNTTMTAKATRQTIAWTDGDKYSCSNTSGVDKFAYVFSTSSPPLAKVS